jgi:DNA-binding GntR family transcriptional regulator
MDGHERLGRAWRPMFDDAYQAVLAAIRDGRLPHDVDHDETEFGAAVDLAPLALQGALERLTDMGLVRPGSNGAFRVATLAPARWAQDVWALVGYLEVDMRSSMPAITDQDVERYAGIVEDARRAAAERDPAAMDTAMTASFVFWADVTPNRLASRFTVRALEQLRFGLATTVPWTVWRVEGWLAASLQAARLRDVPTAERAAHVLLRLWSTFLEEAAVTLGIDAPDLLVPPPIDPDEDAWVPDDLWYQLLGAVRDGSLERGREYGFAELLPRFRVPYARLLPRIRRLELMGLVVAGAHGDGSIRIATPTVEDWVESQELLLGLHEQSARWSVPYLTADEREAVVARIDLAGRYAQVRDYAYPVVLTDITRYLAVHSRNRAVRASTLVVISRMAYVLEDPPRFKQWNMQDFLELSREAVETADADLAAEAAHALTGHFDAHIAGVRDRYAPGTEHPPR